MEKDSANPSLKDTQKLILNASKIKRQHGRNEVRIIKNKNLDVFFLVHDERNKKMYVYDALSLEQKGELRYELSTLDTKKIAKIVTVEISKDIQNAGVGTKFLKFAENSFKLKGVKYIELYASKSRASTPTKILEEWYTKLGYTQTTFSPISPNRFVKTKVKYTHSKYKRLKHIIPANHQKKFASKRYYFFHRKLAKKIQKSYEQDFV